MGKTRAERQSAEIADQVAAFLAQGGQIEQLGNTLPKEPEFEMRNGRPRYREAQRYAPQARGGAASRREAKRSGPKPKAKPKPRAKRARKASPSPGVEKPAQVVPPPVQVDAAVHDRTEPPATGHDRAPADAPVHDRSAPDTAGRDWRADPVFQGLGFGEAGGVL